MLVLMHIRDISLGFMLAFRLGQQLQFYDHIWTTYLSIGLFHTLFAQTEELKLM